MDRLGACLVTYKVTRDVLTRQVLEPLERTLHKETSLGIQASFYRLTSLLGVLENLSQLTAYLNQWFMRQAKNQGHSHLKEILKVLEISLETEALSLYKFWGSGQLTINLCDESDIDTHLVKLRTHLERSVLALQKTVTELVHHSHISTQANNDLNERHYTVLTGYKLFQNGMGISKVRQVQTVKEIEKKGPGCLGYILDTLQKQLKETR